MEEIKLNSQNNCTSDIYTTNFIPEEEYKSKILLGNITIFNTKSFNKIQKFFLKKLLGMEIQDINR